MKAASTTPENNRPITVAVAIRLKNAALISSIYTPEPMIQPHGAKPFTYDTFSTGSWLPGFGHM